MINNIHELDEALKHVYRRSAIAISAGDQTFELERLVVTLHPPGVIFIAKPLEPPKPKEQAATDEFGQRY